VTARLEPATIDGLVYASSMVVLYAARHRLAVPALARWLLARGIVATLGANVAHGWHAGPLGAAVAAWPAASLFGSYELLLWLVRTAATMPAAPAPTGDQYGPPPDQRHTGLHLVPRPGQTQAVPVDDNQPGSDRADGPNWVELDDRCMGGCRSEISRLANARDDDAAAVEAYLFSLDVGRPLSERKLAAMFGKTSRRWAPPPHGRSPRVFAAHACSANCRTANGSSRANGRASDHVIRSPGRDRRDL
jgi:hypothetical protein